MKRAKIIEFHKKKNLKKKMELETIVAKENVYPDKKVCMKMISKQ